MNFGSQNTAFFVHLCLSLSWLLIINVSLQIFELRWNRNLERIISLFINEPLHCRVFAVLAILSHVMNKFVESPRLEVVLFDGCCQSRTVALKLFKVIVELVGIYSWLSFVVIAIFSDKINHLDDIGLLARFHSI